MRCERVRLRVASVDAPGHALLFEGAARLGYDKLLLAVGSCGRPAPWPGSPGPGVHYFVTLGDLEGLDREALKGQRAVVIGGGGVGGGGGGSPANRGPPVALGVRPNWDLPPAPGPRASPRAPAPP